MKLVAISVSLPQAVEVAAQTVQTGIFKTPTDGRLWLNRLNLAGDGQADLENHGGFHKAVYVYPQEHYPAWEAELQRPHLPPGQFGENFTTVGLSEDTVHIGDRFNVGEAEVEVTQPRVPCYKLGIRMGDPAFVKRFLHSERSGFYLRVLREGHVTAGDAITHTHADPAGLSIRAVHRLMFAKGERDASWRTAVERAMDIPALSQEWRDQFVERLLRA